MNFEEADTGSTSPVPEEDSGAQSLEQRPGGADSGKRKAVLEALLYAAEQPLSLDRLVSIMEDCPRREIRGLVDTLNTEYLEGGRPFEIVEVSGGYQVRTRPEYAGWITKLQPQRPQRLGRAALESLAIVAYRQPVTRAELESIRGVDAGAVIGSLLEKKLVRILGRKEVPGRPILYGTSPEFLELFGLKNLASLPTLREIDAILEKEETAEAMQEAAGMEGQRPQEDAVGVAGDGAVAMGEGDKQGSEGHEEVEENLLEEYGEDWEDGGDMETAELDAALRSAKTKLLSYDEVNKDAPIKEAGDEQRPDAFLEPGKTEAVADEICQGEPSTGEGKEQP